MKKIITFLVFLFTISIINVKANEIKSIDIDVYIDENANAKITQKWNVKGSDGTEWYLPLRDLGNSKLSNFTVSMDGQPLTYKKWNINESLEAKRGYYGINYTATDTELCFGKYDYNEHTFTLQYTLSNYIINTSDSQILYWTYLPILQDVNFQNFTLKIRSFYDFPEDLDVWGYGYKGYAYVDKAGFIALSNSEDSTMNGNYVVALVKFPLHTFNTTNTSSNFSSFDDVLKAASEGTFEYDYGNKPSIWQKIWNFIREFFWMIIMIPITIISVISARRSGYGYKDNKKIDKKEVPNFRDIPCNKDIYYANALLFLNNFDYKETNILGAIILKWVKQEKVKFIKQETGLFKKETNCLDLRGKPTFTPGDEEEKLFNIMYEASEDGILEPKEFGKWAKNNYSRFFDIFKGFKDNEVTKLRSQNHIYIRANKDECKKTNVMDDMIYEDSKKLYGLKKFLQEFSSIDTRETIEVHIWDEYLMFAYLFGIADKVAKQLKNLYPELLEQNQNMDYATIIMINNFSTTTVNAASSARSAAENYHSGGGGFSVGGGGGGSFGGGGFSGGGSR